MDNIQTSSTTSTTRSTPEWPRYLNAVVGGWLFVSAFLWGHTDGEFTNAWIVGGAMFVCALLALATPAIRFVNTLLAAWLFFSTLVIGGAQGTVINHIVVAIVAFVLSVLPNRTGTAQQPVQRTV